MQFQPAANQPQPLFHASNPDTCMGSGRTGIEAVSTIQHREVHDLPRPLQLYVSMVGSAVSFNISQRLLRYPKHAEGRFGWDAARNIFRGEANFDSMLLLKFPTECPHSNFQSEALEC